MKLFSIILIAILGRSLCNHIFKNMYWAFASESNNYFTILVEVTFPILGCSLGIGSLVKHDLTFKFLSIGCSPCHRKLVMAVFRVSVFALGSIFVIYFFSLIQISIFMVSAL